MNASTPLIRALAARLKRRPISGWTLVLDEIRPLRQRVGWVFINVGVAAEKGRRRGGPAMTAIVSSGGRDVKPWIEGRFYPTIEIDGATIRTRIAGIEDELIAVMGEVIPPGGHLMIDYESGGQEQTFNELRLGISPAATSLGGRMLAAGFVGEFKDWYFSEGGYEGPRKLQANKPPDAAAARRAIANRIRELREFKRFRPHKIRDAETGLRFIFAQTRVDELIDHLRKHRPPRRTLRLLRVSDLIASITQALHKISPSKLAEAARETPAAAKYPEGMRLLTELAKHENMARPARSAGAHGRRRRPVPSR